MVRVLESRMPPWGFRKFPTERILRNHHRNHHFVHGENQAQRRAGTCLRPRSLYSTERGFGSKELSVSPADLPPTPHLAAASKKCSRLTFLVLEPQLLLDLLAGEVDDAGELGAIESLCDVVGAVVLDEGQQLLPATLLTQDLEDVGEAWTDEEHEEGVRLGRLVAGRL